MLQNLNEWSVELLGDKFSIDDSLCQHIRDFMSYGRQSLVSNRRGQSDLALSRSNKVNKESNLLDLRNQSLNTFKFSAFRDIQRIFAKKNCFVNVDLSMNTKLAQLGLT